MSQENRFCAKCGAPLEAGAAFCPKCGTPVGQVAQVAGTSVSGFDALMRESAAQQYWIRRFFAFVIDAVIVVIILAIVAIALAIPVLLLSGVGALTVLFAGIFSVVSGLILFLYFVVAEVSAGATLGKRVIGLKVVGLNGGNPTVVQAFVRNISKIYWLLLLLDVIVGLAISKKYTQKYSDRFIGTEVVAR